MVVRPEVAAGSLPGRTFPAHTFHISVSLSLTMSCQCDNRNVCLNKNGFGDKVDDSKSELAVNETMFWLFGKLRPHVGIAFDMKCSS